MITESPVLSERADRVLTLTLNRPHTLNAITDEMLDELHSQLDAVDDDATVGAVVITGNGRGFCAGQNLAVVPDDGGIDVAAHLQDHYHPVIRMIRGLSIPVIASINGVAAGAGLSLALACDLRIAGESASLVNAFVRIGLVPDAGNSFFLPRLIGLARATELAMLGDSVDAGESLRIGLVNRVVADDKLADATHALARRLADGPASLGLIKHLLNISFDHDLSAQLAAEEEAQAEAATTPDFIEGVSAFLEKRAAHFSGRAAT